MIQFLLLQIKYLIAGKDLEELHRYRIATQEAARWLGPDFPEVEKTADWIESRAKLKGAHHISTFREQLREGRNG